MRGLRPPTQGRYCLRVQVCRSDRWGLARVWGFKSRRQLRAWVAGNHQSLLVVGTWSEARLVESLKPEQLASARACIVAAVSPQVGLGAPRRQAQGPFGCSCSCLGCETSGREKSTPTWLLPTKSPIHVPLHPPSPPLISDPAVHTRRGGDPTV